MPFSLFDVIKYEGPGTGDLFAWRHPNHELKPGARLIVQESQVAVFLKQGQVVGSYGPGSHKIDGNNPVFLTGLTKLVTGGVSPNSAQIWFINLVDFPTVRWGTPSPIPIPVPGNVTSRSSALTLSVRARGTFGVRFDINRIGAFISRLAGTRDVISLSDIQGWFRDLTVDIIKSTLAQVIVMNHVDMGHITAYLQILSEDLNKKVSESLSEYGILVDKFKVSDVDVDKNTDDYKIYARRVQQVEDVDAGAESTRIAADAQRYASVADSQAKQIDQKLREYSYQQERAFDALNNAAANTGSGSDVMNTAMGMGMGMNMGGSIGGMMANAMGDMATFGIMTPKTDADAAIAAASGANGDAAKPSPAEDQSQQQQSAVDPVETLKQLKRMLDADLITQDIYNAKRDEILSRM